MWLLTPLVRDRITLDSLDGILGKFPTNFAKVPAAVEEVFHIFRSQLQAGIRDDAGCVYPLQDPIQVSIDHLSNFQRGIPKANVEGYGMAKLAENRIPPGPCGQSGCCLACVIAAIA